MNFAIVRFIIGWVLEFEAAFLLLPTLVGIFYGEMRTSLAFLATAAVCLLVGFLLKQKKPAGRDLYTREGFVTVALSWIAMSAFGALPFLSPERYRIILMLFLKPSPDLLPQVQVF